MEVCYNTLQATANLTMISRFHRSMTRPFFSRDRISHFDIFGTHADEVIELILSRLQEGLAVDVQVCEMNFG